MIFPFFLVGAIYLIVNKAELIVTNTRVYGVDAFNNRIDLPLDLISVVSISFFKGITIGTSSGKMSFTGISNNREIHAEISKLLNNRQTNKQEPQKASTTEELKNYKELLDESIITQEEFEAKKKQLLNL